MTKTLNETEEATPNAKIRSALFGIISYIIYAVSVCCLLDNVYNLISQITLIKIIRNYSNLVPRYYLLSKIVHFAMHSFAIIPIPRTN